MEMDKQTGADAPGGIPFTPTEAWIDAFATQCTHEMRLRAKRYAARRARGVGKAGGYVDDYYVRELVENALADTLLGDVRWDPNDEMLESHVMDVIKSRTRHDRVRAGRFQRSSIDAREGSYARAEIESSLQQDRDGDHGETRFAVEVLVQLQGLAENDRQVLQLLNAIASGARTKAEILELSELSAKAYRNARDRLSRLVKSLDPETLNALGLS